MIHQSNRRIPRTCGIRVGIHGQSMTNFGKFRMYTQKLVSKLQDFEMTVSQVRGESTGPYRHSTPDELSSVISHRISDLWISRFLQYSTILPCSQEVPCVRTVSEYSLLLALRQQSTEHT